MGGVCFTIINYFTHVIDRSERWSIEGSENVIGYWFRNKYYSDHKSFAYFLNAWEKINKTALLITQVVCILLIKIKVAAAEHDGIYSKLYHKALFILSIHLHNFIIIRAVGVGPASTAMAGPLLTLWPLLAYIKASFI